MAFFIPILAKKYNPNDIDAGMFAMNIAAFRSVPVVCTKMVAEDGCGTATVNGKPISKGKCVKFDFSPLPIYFLPVGEVATEFDTVYTVKLKGFRTVNGGKFATCTFKVKTASKPCDDGKHKENESIAKDVSDEGIVLLRNDGVLPLASGTSVKLLGDYNNFRITAVGASLIKPRWMLNILEAIEKSGIIKSDKNADTALYFISRGSGENKDNKPIKGDYYLTDEEKSGLQKAAELYKKLIIVLNTGYPIEMSFINSIGTNAIIWTGFSGQRGAESLIDILCGTVNPSGRIADTWTYDYFDNPSSHNFVNLDENSPIYSDDGKKLGASVYYEERQFIGYRFFDTFKKDVAFPFGHGLSYSDFSIRSNANFDGSKLTVNAAVTNNGSIGGKCSVLIFAELPKGKLIKPLRVFCGFDKTKLLGVGESQTLTIDIPAKDFAAYEDEQNLFVLEKGEYAVYVGGSIGEATKVCSFNVEEDKIIEKTISVCAPVEQVGSIDENGKVLKRTKIIERENCINTKAAYTKRTYKELLKHKGKKITFSDVKMDINYLDDFISQLTLKELVDFTVCNGSCWQPKKSGAAGKIAHSKRLAIPTYYMSDGNCGVNLNVLTTGFPSSNLLAGTFNKQLAYNVGKVLALESKEYGISINLGPGGNLHRNILCGRHSEYFSEDPILTGTLMAYQAKGLEENGVKSTYKHFLANNMEFERKSAHSVLDERTLRELYLRVFDKAFSLYKPSCVMTSYNPVNGIYPCENSLLLNDLLREQWGFDGFVMTDWGSCDTADAIRSVNAGTNLLTPGDKKLFRKVYRAAKRGEISKGTLQEGVKRIIKVLLRCKA